MRTSSVHVRPVRDDDFPAIAALTSHFIATTPIHFGYDPVTADELRASWLKSRGVYPFLVAEVMDKFAGYCKASVWRERTAYSWTPEAGIYVDPAAHRRGVGRALYERLAQVLRAQGFHSVVGGITLPNDASVKLHEAVGFKQVAFIPQSGWKFGRWWDIGFWQLMLNEPSQQATTLRTPQEVGG